MSPTDKKVKDLKDHLLQHLADSDTVKRWAIREGWSEQDYLDTLLRLFGPRYTVQQVARRMRRSVPWVTHHARKNDLGVREAWYGKKERYWFHEPDLRVFDEIKNNRLGRAIGFQPDDS